MKTIKKILIFIGFLLLLVYAFHQLGLASALSNTDQKPKGSCPAGSYDIGINKDGSPICKLEPTGCPYGDSIPLGPDCDRHANDAANKPPLVQSSTIENDVTSPVDYPSDYQGK